MAKDVPEGSSKAAKPAETAATPPAPKPTAPSKEPADGTAPAKRAAPAATKKTNGRLSCKSPAEIAKALAAVVDLVKKKPWLRADQIRAELKREAKEMPRILKEGLSTRVLESKGQKRSTSYATA